MRKTKIVCTIGPSCSDEATLTAMMKAGMNVARLNFSHGTHEEQLARIELIDKLRKELKLPIAILLDTKGPEYRIRRFRDGKVTLTEGEEFIFTTRELDGDETIVSVNYKGLADDLEPGDIILLNNGLLKFRVKEIIDTDIRCETLVGGELSDRKSMSFPNKLLKQPYLSEQDKADLIFAMEHDVDFIACSFVSCRQDLLDVKNFMREYFDTHKYSRISDVSANICSAADSNNSDNKTVFSNTASVNTSAVKLHDPDEIELLAKIENQAGIDNIEEICSECCGIMIGRGDMGVEIPFEQLPAAQKHLITRCRLLGKRVITATEMLESMIHNPRPTRAETSDVANAVYDGTSAIMLSGETAAGKYPVLAVETMARIAEETEKNINYEKRFRNSEFRIKNTVDAISHATCGMAIDINAKAIAVCTLSGMTARMVSRFRNPADILGFTTNEKTYHQLALSWGITPALGDTYDSTEVLFYAAKQKATEVFGLNRGDHLIITGGMTRGISGNTNMLKIETI